MSHAKRGWRRSIAVAVVALVPLQSAVIAASHEPAASNAHGAVEQADVAAASSPGDAAAAPAAVRTRGAALLFIGSITPDAVARVAGLLDASPQVREVVIESSGGDVPAGMDFGELVHARGLDVRVTGTRCASSCANYVFPAGRRKTIDPGSLVLWHGSMLQEGLVESFDVSQVKHPSGRSLNWRERRLLLRTVRADFQRLSARQARFYERLGVDPAITVIGQQQGCRCNWTLVVEDMARFGVGGVSAPEDYASPGYGDPSMEWELVRIEVPAVPSLLQEQL